MIEFHSVWPVNYRCIKDEPENVFYVYYIEWGYEPDIVLF